MTPTYPADPQRPRMRGEHVDALLDELSNLPEAIAAPIATAWHAKEDLCAALRALLDRIG